MQAKNIKSLINFSERFNYLISESKMTQREVAEAIGITQSAVNHYKSGRSEPKSMELYKISKLFGVSIEWLLMGEETKADESSIIARRKQTGNRARRNESDAQKNLTKSVDITTNEKPRTPNFTGVTGWSVKKMSTLCETNN